MTNKRKLAFCGGLGVLFTIFLVLGAELALNARLNLKLSAVARKLAAVVGFAPIVILLLVIFLSMIPVILEKLRSFAFEEKPSRFSRSFLATFAFISICWLPAFIAFFPGIFAYDAPTQIQQAATGTLTADHSLLHTCLLYSSIKLGGLFGSYNLGLAIYSLLQMLTMSSCAAYSIVYLRRLNLPKSVLAFGAVILAFSPICALLSISTARDVFFSALFLLLIVFIADIGFAPDRFYKSVLLQLRFVATVCLMALFRDKGILAFLFCIPFLVVAAGKKRIKMTALCMAGLALFVLSRQAFAYALNARNNNVAEALSVPIQQLARVYTEKSDQLGDGVPEEILRLLPDAGRYDPYISDPVKNTFNNEAFSGNAWYYAKLWVKLGLEYPDVYASSFLMNTIWLWYPDTQYPCPQSLIETSTKDSIFGITQSSITPGVRGFYASLTSHAVHRDFPLNLLMMSIAIPVWTLLFAIVMRLYYARGKRKHLGSLMLPLGLCLSLAFAPVILVRYVFSLYVALPFLIGSIFHLSGEGN